jgi:hypothetical protein
LWSILWSICPRRATITRAAANGKVVVGASISDSR